MGDANEFMPNVQGAVAIGNCVTVRLSKTLHLGGSDTHRLETREATSEELVGVALAAPSGFLVAVLNGEDVLLPYYRYKPSSPVERSLEG